MSTQKKNKITVKNDKISYNIEWLKNDLLYSMTPLLNASTSFDFRKVPTYPTEEDLFGQEPIALCANKVDCAYNNCEEYLDHFFRLLREDFMYFLRDNFRYLNNHAYIKSFNSDSITQERNIWYFKNVHIINRREMERNSINASVLFFRFDSRHHATEFDYENSDQFKTGALIFLSMDKFKTYVLGIVVQSCHLNDGIVGIEVVGYQEVKQWPQIDLFEPASFYEPYRYVMAVLQDMNETIFPMKEYIVYGRKIISPPRYLAKNSIYEINEIQFDILKHDKWPSAKKLKMDINQYEAFKGALTKEFTLIQGPPGTGKSYIALQIIKTIIENMYYTNKLTNPIMVVCLTNHSLDHFLEGVFKITKNISRFGGYSKSDILAKHVAKLRYRKNIWCTEFMEDDFEQNAKVLEENENFHAFNVREVERNCGILDLSNLMHVLTVNDYNSWFQDSYDLLTWLLFNISHVDGVNPIDFIKTNNLLSLMPNNIHDYKTKDKLYCISLDGIKKYCDTVQDQLSGLNLEDESNLSEKTHLTITLKIMKTVEVYITNHLKLYESKSFVVFKNEVDRDSLEISNRWLLYYNWVNLFFMMESKFLNDKYYSIFQCEESVSKFNSIKYLDVVKNKHVIGMTTSAAAKHRYLLKNLKCPIGKFSYFVLSFQYYYLLLLLPLAAWALRKCII